MASDTPLTAEQIQALRARVLEAYDKAFRDRVTRPGAFGLVARAIQQELGCDFRVACMLTDCWIIEHEDTKQYPTGATSSLEDTPREKKRPYPE